MHELAAAESEFLISTSKKYKLQYLLVNSSIHFLFQNKFILIFLF